MKRGPDDPGYATMGKFLHTVLCLSWFTGCFPVTNPWNNFSKYEFRWRHPIVLFSVLILAFDITIMLDFGIHSVVNYAKTTLGGGTSAIIAESTFIFYIIMGDAALRIIALLYCRTIVALIHLVVHLETVRDYAIAFCALMYKIYIIIVVANILNFTHESLVISNIVNVFKPIPAYVNMTLLPQSDWVIRGAFWLQNIFSTASHSFGLSIFLLLGTNLISLYCRFCGEIGRCWNAKVTDCSSINNLEDYEWLGDVDTYLDRFVDKFTKLKTAFCLYSTVAGPLVFALMLASVTALIHSVYSLSNTQEMRNIAGTIGCIFWIGFLSCFGNFMENRLQWIRENLQNAMASNPKIFTHPRLNPAQLAQVTQWVVDWKWKLSAGNLFRVNHSLLPAALGTAMTYVIFGFQLRMSEETKECAASR